MHKFVFADRIKLPLSFCPKALRADVCRLSERDWFPHFVPQHFHGHWSIVPLRGPKGESHPVRMSYSDPSCREFCDTAYLEYTPHIREILQDFRCPLGAVRLMCLESGGRIHPHQDLDLCAEQGDARLHIPITTSPQVAFWLNDRKVLMQPGECWYLRLSDTHWVENNGTQGRIHLVIDVTVNAWLRQQLSAGQSA